MMAQNPLLPDILFRIGPVPIDRAVVTTWAIMALLCALLALVLRRRRVQAGAAQSILEILVETIESQLRDVLGRDPWPFMPLLGGMFIFLCLANLVAIVPGGKPPTGHVETPAALALIVFFSVHYYGMRARGPGAYLRKYIRPNPILLPLNLLSELTRTFSLMVRLFGNMMSHEFVIAIVLMLAGLLLPVPFMALGILIGLIQAYIFTILAAVYIGAAISGSEA